MNGIDIWNLFSSAFIALAGFFAVTTVYDIIENLIMEKKESKECSENRDVTSTSSKKEKL